jgi:hypothetical protein
MLLSILSIPYDSGINTYRYLKFRYFCRAWSARRGRKRKGAALDAPAPAPANKKARISNAPKPASTLMRQASRTQIADNKIAPEPERVREPQRAPVAQMW